MVHNNKYDTLEYDYSGVHFKLLLSRFRNSTMVLVGRPATETVHLQVISLQTDVHLSIIPELSYNLNAFKNFRKTYS